MSRDHDFEKYGPLLARQEQLENDAYTEGAARFRRRLQQATDAGHFSTVGAGTTLLKRGIGNMEAAITAMIEAPAGKGLGRRHLASRWCRLVGADVAAYLTLKVVLDALGHRRNLQSTALTIGDRLQDELIWRRFREQEPQLFDWKLQGFRTSSYEHMSRSLQASARIKEIEFKDLEMAPAQKMRVGMKMLDILIETTGLVQAVVSIPGTKRRKRIVKGLVHDVAKSTRKTQMSIEPTLATRDWIDRRNETMELWNPIVMPMIVPPADWSPDHDGGYRFALRMWRNYGLVRGLTKVDSSLLGRAVDPAVFTSLNEIQRTPWRVNRRVLETIEAIQAAGGSFAGVPSSSDESFPAKPQDIATNEAAKKLWKRRKAAVHRRRIAERQLRIKLTKTLMVAKKMQDEQEIFFPHSLDFRGRIYPIASYFTPQGEDVSRALLTFAKGKVVDPDGARWLATHGANCLGETPDGIKMSKQPLEFRRDWIASHTADILKAADAPLENTWWVKADEPLQFLAFCFEWANLIRANDRGEEYVCSLPCGMDGTCNGLQHFSALLRDEVGACAVNITPQERPQDVYSMVAEASIRRLETAAESGNTVAALWIGLHVNTGIINRKLTKRPTMTFGYGSKQFGFKAQLLEYIRQLPDAASVRSHFLSAEGKPQIHSACELMSRTIWEALEEIVVAAFAGMDWMQRATRGITAQNHQVRWTVPITNFPVRQDYFRMEKQRVETVLVGSIIKPSVYHHSDKVDRRKQGNAIAPNFIHSLDAAALMLTVQDASENGVECFGMVHDSYSTVPADCSVLAKSCRQSFVRLYQNQDVVGALHRDLAAQWKRPEKCPAPPAKGTLDVSQVIGSEYFFS